MNLYSIKTPAFIYDQSILSENCQRVYKLRQRYDIHSLFSIKSLSVPSIVKFIEKYMSGLSVSSFYEARLANDLITNDNYIHYISPLIRDDEIEGICDICDYLTFNTIQQWCKYKLHTVNKVSSGIRVNTSLSFVKDHRYDPCSNHSKLGVELNRIKKLIDSDPIILDGIEGLHFHTNSESSNLIELLENVRHIDNNLSFILSRANWINLGGGYYFDDDMDFDSFEEAISLMHDKYKLEVIIEPGTSIVQDAGKLLARITDIYESGDMRIVLLDTTVNHMPEVLEFQYQPDIEECRGKGEHEYILAGATCLSGDKFGIYRFESPLRVGDCITFLNVGAYSLVKAHMFNGINLPSVYLERENGQLELLKEYTYEDFLNRCGANFSESLRKRA